jgi:N-formylglutamate amidohydrolase
MELIRAYSDPLQNKNSVQIEVNRKLYMNEETREKIDNFKILKQDLKKLINEIKKQYDEGYL